jgi:hypothetical protein
MSVISVFLDQDVLKSIKENYLHGAFETWEKNYGIAV